MSGHLGNLSAQQEKALAELKAQTVDVHRPDYDDYYYLRWLRAREFNVKNAETMMRNNIEWRKGIGADSILTDYKPPEVLEKCFPRGTLGPDKDGCPVRILPYEKLDLKGCFLSMPQTELVKFMVYLFEQDIAFMKDEGRKLNKVIEKHVYIIDLENYTFGQAANRYTIELMNSTLKVYEAHYPERMKSAYFINVPTYFWIVFELLRPFLSKETVNKFKYFGKDGYKEVLGELMDPDYIPVYLGGNRRDPDGDPRCKTIINFGDFIPKSYYCQNVDPKRLEEDGMKAHQLSWGSSFLVDVEVKEPDTSLTLEFRTLKHDLALGFYLRADSSIKKGDKHLMELVPLEKVSCHFSTESRVFMCERPGIYVVKFDNSYSWFTSKTLYYKITLRPSEQLTNGGL